MSGHLSAWEAIRLNDQTSKAPEAVNSEWEPMTPEESRLLGVAVEEFASKHGISLEEEK